MWACQAYGPQGEEHGALCFFGEIGERVCPSQAICHNVLRAERQRVYRRINELAAGGSAVAGFLAENVNGPDELLGGRGD